MSELSAFLPMYILTVFLVFQVCSFLFGSVWEWLKSSFYKFSSLYHPRDDLTRLGDYLDDQIHSYPKTVPSEFDGW